MSCDQFDAKSKLWLQPSSLLLSYVFPIEYIYGDWYWWLGTSDAGRNAKTYMLSRSDNCLESGSRVEGFCIPQFFLSQNENELATANLLASVKWEPDSDNMRVKKSCFEAEQGGRVHPIFVAEHLPDDPRYAKLRLTGYFKQEFPRYAESEFLNHAYLFPEWKHPFLKDQEMKGWSYESHGPVRKLETTGLASYEEDIAYVFTYPEAWPEPAMEWLTRERYERPHNWPSPDLIQDIFECGCHIAPVGRGKRMREPLELLEYARKPSAQALVPDGPSQMNENEWRVSFSVAENKLAATLSPIQRHVMVILKMLKKLYFQDIISTYHLKQLLFWECEKNDKTFWKEENLVHCLLYMLDILVECLKKGHLPHYIIRNSNLLQNVDADLLREVVETVIDLRQNLLKRTLSMFRRLQSLTYSTNIYLNGVSFCNQIDRLQTENLDEAEKCNLKLEICSLFAQKCKDVIFSTNRNIQSNPECTQLLLVPLNAYHSILARILCRQYTLAGVNVCFEEYLVKEVRSLPQGDKIKELSMEYYQQATNGMDCAAFVPESKAMIELREIRKKEACHNFNEIETSPGVLDALGSIQESDLKAITEMLSKELKGQLDTITYDDLENKVMKELNATIHRKQTESSKQEEN